MSLFLAIVYLAAIPHPVHASLSETQWNPQSKRLEVALRLSPDDASWIDKRSKVSGDSKPKSTTNRSQQSSKHPASQGEGGSTDGKSESTKSKLAKRLKYLQSRFRIHRDKPKKAKSAASSEKAERSVVSKTSKTGPDRSKDKYTWVGEQEQRGYIWWFFEIEPSDGRPPEAMTVDLLLDREDNYVHRLVLLGQEKPVSYDFNPNVKTQRIRLTQ